MTATTQPDPPFAFNRLQELTPGESIIGMPYGGVGVGKTWFLGTGGNRNLIIDTGDTGLETLKSKLFKDKVGYNPTIVSVAEKLGVRGKISIATAFDATCDIIDWALAHKRDEFDIISINDVTQLRMFAMNKGLEVGLALGKSFSKQKSDALDATVYAVQDYGAEIDLVNKFVGGYTSIFRNAGVHFFMAAHERLTLTQAKNAKGEPVVGGDIVVKDTRPGFRGRTFPDDVCMYFDVIWHMEAVGSGDTIVYRARTAGGEDITARTNFGGLFPTIYKNPHLLNSIETIQQSRKITT